MNEPTKSDNHPQHPWWEPYLFTVGVLFSFLIALIAFGYVASIPFVEPILFVLATIAALVPAYRAPQANPAVISKVLLTCFFTLASVAKFSKAEGFLGIVYAAVALVWFCLAIHATVLYRKLRKERLATLERRVKSLVRTISDD